MHLNFCGEASLLRVEVGKVGVIEQEQVLTLPLYCHHYTKADGLATLSVIRL